MRASLSARIATAASVAAIAVGSLLLTAGAASAARPGGGHKASEATFVHLNNKVVAHAKHHTDTISGVLTARRKGVTGETVTLFFWSRSHKSFLSTGLTATTGTGGAFSFTITAPTRTSHYEAKFAGDKTSNPRLRSSHSNAITITVKKSHK
jgi:hypothetical protein